MDFAPYQSSPPEHSRVQSPAAAPSPRASLDAARRSAYSPATCHRYQQRQPRFSPPPLQHPQPQRAWSGDTVGRYQSPFADAGLGGYNDHYDGDRGDDGGRHDYYYEGRASAIGVNGRGGGGAGGGGGDGGGASNVGWVGGDYGFDRDGMVSEFDTSLGLRLDYEACLAYLAVPPLGAILLLILERKSDYVRYVLGSGCDGRRDCELAAALAFPPVADRGGCCRFHAWQSSLLFTALFVVHLLVSWSAVLSWMLFLVDLALIVWLVLNAYRDADTLDRLVLAPHFFFSPRLFVLMLLQGMKCRFSDG